MATTLSLHDRAKITLDGTIATAEQIMAARGESARLAPLVAKARANAADCDRIIKALVKARQEVGEAANLATVEIANIPLSGKAAVRVVYHLAQES